MVAILATIAVAAAFLLFLNPTLVALVADFIVPASFITLIWVRKRMIGEPPTDSMSVQAKVCMVLIAAMIVLPMLEGITAINQAEYDQEWELERDIKLTSVTSEQEYMLNVEYMVCVGEGGGRDLITKEALNACDRTYLDHQYEFQLENYYANQTT